MNQPLPATVPPYAGGRRSPRRAFRSLDDRLLGGVAAGLAEHLGVAGAVGAGRVPDRHRARRVRRRDCTPASGWCCRPSAHFEDRPPGLEPRPARASGRAGGRGWPTSARWSRWPRSRSGSIAPGRAARPAVRCSCGRCCSARVGIGVLWRQADEAQRERWLDTTGRIDPIRAVVGRGGWASYARLAAGVGAPGRGAIVLFAVRGGRSASPATSCIAGAARRRSGWRLMVGPWLFRLSSDLTEERGRADPLAGAGRRGRAPARLGAADAGADPEARPTTRPTVARLARAQERDLRQLAVRRADSTDGTTFAARCARPRPRSRTRHGVPGRGGHASATATVAERLRPLVLAAREAMVNAAKHSGADQVDVYAEVRRTRRRGVRPRPRAGLRPRAAVADDRHGRARQHHRPDGPARRRGRRSAAAAGEGTEVRLHAAERRRDEADDAAARGS